MKDASNRVLNKPFHEPFQHVKRKMSFSLYSIFQTRCMCLKNGSPSVVCTQAVFQQPAKTSIKARGQGGNGRKSAVYTESVVSRPRILSTPNISRATPPSRLQRIFRGALKYFPAALPVIFMVAAIAAAPVSAADKPGSETDDDPQVTFRLGGLLMYDAVWYQGHDALQGRTTGYTDEGGFRRARLSAQGSMDEDWDYNVTLDFTRALNNNASNAGAIEIWQVRVTYSGFGAMKIKAGQLYEPFSLEAATSSRATTFMERGLPYALIPVKSIGMGISATPAKGLYLEGGAFTEDLNSASSLDRAFTGRVAYAPVDTKGRLLHVGAAASHRVPGDSTLRYRARAESDLAPAWFSTGTIRNVDNIVLTGVEAAIVSGAASLQAEYVRSDVSRSNGGQARNIDGYYVYVSWFLTGESRPYRNGRFSTIKPESRWGAWEVAARNSAISDDRGETLSDITLGLNWYLNRHARLMANYVVADYEQGSVQGNADVFQVRGQIDF